MWSIISCPDLPLLNYTCYSAKCFGCHLVRRCSASLISKIWSRLWVFQKTECLPLQAFCFSKCLWVFTLYNGICNHNPLKGTLNPLTGTLGMPYLLLIKSYTRSMMSCVAPPPRLLHPAAIPLTSPIILLLNIVLIQNWQETNVGSEKPMKNRTRMNPEMVDTDAMKYSFFLMDTVQPKRRAHTRKYSSTKATLLCTQESTLSLSW
jgi:hypothetical protein